MAPAPEDLVLGRALANWKNTGISIGMGFLGGFIGMLIGPWAMATGAVTSVLGRFVGESMTWKMVIFSLGAAQIGAGMGTLGSVADAGVGVSSASDISTVGGVAWVGYIRVKTIDLIKQALAASETALTWTAPASTSTTTTTSSSTTATSW